MNTFENETSKLKRFLKTIRLNESLISTLLGGLVVVVVGVLIYNYFSSVNKSVEQVEVIADGVQFIEEDGRFAITYQSYFPEYYLPMVVFPKTRGV